MAGFIPGLLPTNHSQEKEFAQAYEDVLERYKGKEEYLHIIQEDAYKYYSEVSNIRAMLGAKNKQIIYQSHRMR